MLGKQVNVIRKQSVHLLLAGLLNGQQGFKGFKRRQKTFKQFTVAGGGALQNAHHVFGLSSSGAGFLNQRCQIPLHQGREFLAQHCFQRAKTLLSLSG